MVGISSIQESWHEFAVKSSWPTMTDLQEYLTSNSGYNYFLVVLVWIKRSTVLEFICKIFG